MLYALIMAGGSGTRFWPASRDALPKQLLQLYGDRTMLQSTVDRLEGLVSASQTLVMTNARLVAETQRQLPQLTEASVLGEPCRRDTAPCIGLAAAIFARQDPQATMLVLPSDHVIQPREQFQAAVRMGMELIDQQPQRFVTFGIPPTYPAESFGYIERGPVVRVDQSNPTAEAFEVLRFREKPKRDVAESYLAAGTFYWNSGIFMWRASALLDALKQHEPEMTEHLEAIAEAYGKPTFAETFAQHFEALRGKSIDYAVMEKYTPVVVIEAPYQWDDVGSWQALARLNAPDAAGNVARGQHIGIDTRTSIIQSDDGHVIVTIDVEDLLVIHTKDATLVAPKHAEERVRQAVEALRTQGLHQFL